MKAAIFALLLLPFHSACGTTAISGEMSADGSCSATIDGTEIVGPDDGVRVVYQPLAGAEESDRHVLVAYCLLSRPGEIPVRVDFVKMDATEGGLLEPGNYVIDAEGDQPRSIGVIITAPEYLDVMGQWQPTTGTLVVESSTPTALEATFEMEIRTRGFAGL